MRIGRGVVAIVVMLGLRAAPTHACSCEVGDAPGTTPTGTSRVPTNTHVWVDLKAVLRSAGEVAARSKSPFVELELRAVDASGHEGRSIAFERRDFGPKLQPIAELTPLSELSPDTRYRVIARRVTGRSLESFLGGVDAGPSMKTVDHVYVGGFTTGEAAVHERVPAAGTLRARYLLPADDSCAGEPFVEVSMSMPPKVAGSALPVRFEVWVVDADRKIDYRAPPGTIVAANGSSLVLGYPDICGDTSFDWRGFAKKVRIGIRAVDLAGNESEPSEAELEMRSAESTSRLIP